MRTIGSRGLATGRHQGLGNSSIGGEQFTRELLQTWIADEQRFLDAIPRTPNLQCGWQLLVQSASSRANHMIRTLPPDFFSECAADHDGTWRVAMALETTSETESQLRLSRCAWVDLGCRVQGGALQQRTEPRGRTHSTRSTSATQQSPPWWLRGLEAQKSHKTAVWPKFMSVQSDWIAKGFIGGQVGLSSREVRDHQW